MRNCGIVVHEDFSNFQAFSDKSTFKVNKYQHKFLISNPNCKKLNNKLVS